MHPGDQISVGHHQHHGCPALRRPLRHRPRVGHHAAEPGRAVRLADRRRRDTGGRRIRTASTSRGTRPSPTTRSGSRPWSSSPPRRRRSSSSSRPRARRAPAASDRRPSSSRCSPRREPARGTGRSPSRPAPRSSRYSVETIDFFLSPGAAPDLDEPPFAITELPTPSERTMLPRGPVDAPSRAAVRLVALKVRNNKALFQVGGAGRRPGDDRER